MEEDFGFGGNGQTGEPVVNTEEKTNLETGNIEIEGKTNLDGNKDGQETSNGNKAGASTETSPTGGQEESTLATGDVIELDGVTYTVNQNGDLVNEKGEVFKTKSEVEEAVSAV